MHKYFSIDAENFFICRIFASVTETSMQAINTKTGPNTGAWIVCLINIYVRVTDKCMETHKYNPMQTVKREFFAMRNGIISDTYRKAGTVFKIVFGLNLPQLVEIAGRTPHSRELAEALWANTTTRESMLLAPMLIDPETFSEEDARRWIASVCSYEVADILCHRLLRKTP